MAGVTPKDIWDALEQAGASTVQAAGIMANMISESSLDPEAIGDNGTSFGLVQDHGDYSYLVTGNPAADMRAQITNMVNRGGLRAASGSTPQEVAGNFAARYEICVGCQPGGDQYNGRVANAATVSGWAASGNWPQSAGAASDQATLTSAQGAPPQATCAWQIFGGVNLPIIGNVGSICIVSKSQVRALVGTGLVVSGFLIAGVGLSAIAIAASISVGEKVLAAVPGVGRGVGVVRRVAGASGAARATQATQATQASQGLAA